MVDVYSKLEGFLTPEQNPHYFEMLANIGNFTEKKEAKVLVALSDQNEILGGVVYFGEMSEYGSGGIATTIKNSSGIRLLGVSEKARGIGVGKELTNSCIQLAKRKNHSQVILHTTLSMQSAWRLYEKLGFVRSDDLDFIQGELKVFGFILKLGEN